MRRIKKELKGEHESRVLIEVRENRRGQRTRTRRIKKGKFPSAPLPSFGALPLDLRCPRRVQAVARWS